MVPQADVGVHPPRLRARRSRSRFVQGDVGAVHAAMTEAAGDQDLWIVGGGELAGRFRDAGLLDEVWLQYAPVTLGAGRPLLPAPRTSCGSTEVARNRDFACARYDVVGPLGSAAVAAAYRSGVSETWTEITTHDDLVALLGEPGAAGPRQGAARAARRRPRLAVGLAVLRDGDRRRRRRLRRLAQGGPGRPAGARHRRAHDRARRAARQPARRRLPQHPRQPPRRA